MSRSFLIKYISLQCCKVHLLPHWNRELAPAVTVVVPDGHGCDDFCRYPSVYVPGGLFVQGERPFSEYSPGPHISREKQEFLLSDFPLVDRRRFSLIKITG